MAIKYRFSGEVWQHEASGGWYFVSLPQSISREIRTHHQWQEEGWGRLRAKAMINHTIWQTAIWFDTQRNTYLLPLKAAVRKKETVEIGQKIDLTLFL